MNKNYNKAKADIDRFLDLDGPAYEKKDLWSMFSGGVLLTIGTLLLLIAGTMFYFSHLDKPAIPTAKITEPMAGSETECEVCVVGKTEHIQPGQYIWLTVDKPEKSLTFPKVYINEPNIGFRTEIHEGGKKEPYNISLYVLNETYHKLWLSWMDNNKFGGLHMPPESRRLDTVRVLLKG